MISSQEMIYEQLAVSFRLSSLGVRLNSSAVQTLVFADPIRHSHYQFDLRGREVTNQLRGWRTIENSSAVLFRDQYLGLGKYLQTEYIRLTALIYIFLSIQWPSQLFFMNNGDMKSAPSVVASRTGVSAVFPIDCSGQQHLMVKSWTFPSVLSIQNNTMTAGQRPFANVTEVNVIQWAVTIFQILILVRFTLHSDSQEISVSSCFFMISKHSVSQNMTHIIIIRKAGDI